MSKQYDCCSRRKRVVRLILNVRFYYDLCLCSNVESSPSQAAEVSGSEGLKSDKFYISSALPDGVLQQVEVTVKENLMQREETQDCFVNDDTFI